MSRRRPLPEKAQQRRAALLAAAANDTVDYGTQLDMTNPQIRAAMVADHHRGIRHHGLPCCT